MNMIGEDVSKKLKKEWTEMEKNSDTQNHISLLIWPQFHADSGSDYVPMVAVVSIQVF